MRYHWLRDRETQQQFNIYWDRGSNNHGDYYTKHHPTKYHKLTRHKYVQDKLNCLITDLNKLESSALRGCVTSTMMS